MPAKNAGIFLFPLTKISHIRYEISQKYKKEEGKILEEKYKINLHVLEACNFGCRQCFSKFGTKETLPVEDWKKIVDNCIAGADVAEFNIAGGEPMLYPGLVELVKYIRDKGVKVSLITNGSLMDEEWIKNYAGMYETNDMSGACGRKNRLPQCSQKKEKIFGKIFCKKCYTFEKILHIEYESENRPPVKVNNPRPR